MPPLHITNGDSAAYTLRTFLTDRVLTTCDVLHDGPAPLVDGDAWHDVRATFLASAFGADVNATRASMAAFDRAIAEPERHDEIVLWFEHDLFDQLLVIRTLDLLARTLVRPSARLKPDTTETTLVRLKPDTDTRETPVAGTASVVSGFSRTTISLICIGEFPGVERFVGLGQLDADQLASLYPSRQPVTDAHFALAREAWGAFRASDPTVLFDLLTRLKTPTPELAVLPFFADAVERLFEEYPSTTHGLSRSATAILHALDAGSMTGGTLFVATQNREARPFLGDLGFFDIVRALASARVPLVTISPGPATPDLRDRDVTITDDGRRVLGGGADAVVLNGIDEWRGGVRLQGDARCPWRWDPDRETLVSWDVTYG